MLGWMGRVSGEWMKGRMETSCTLYIYVSPTPLSLLESLSQVCVSNCNNVCVCDSFQGMFTCTWTLLVWRAKLCFIAISAMLFRFVPRQER